MKIGYGIGSLGIELIGQSQGQIMLVVLLAQYSTWDRGAYLYALQLRACKCVWLSFPRSHLFQVDVERFLLPKHVRLLFRPIEATSRRNVEIPHHASDDKSHLCPGNVLAKTVTGTHVKRLEYGSDVPSERSGGGIAQPALRKKLVRARKVGLGSISCPLGYSDSNLQQSSCQPRRPHQSRERRWGELNILTPPGTQWPAIRAPFDGIMRVNPQGIGGHIRSPSCSTAVRYGKAPVLESVMSSSVLNGPRTSSANLLSFSGFLQR